MNPILRFQDDVVNKLLSEELLIDVNVVALRELQVNPDLMAKKVWLTARASGKSGAGIMVGIPTLERNAPNAPGPDRMMYLPISVFEQPSINKLVSTGTQLDAETIVDYVDAILHQLGIEGLGAIYAESTMPNLEIQAGVLRYDMIFIANVPREDIEQVVCPTLAENALTVTLTSVTAGATIYYTLNELFPGPGNRAALSGESPLDVVVTSGTTIRWAAYKTGMRGSDVGQATIT